MTRLAKRISIIVLTIIGAGLLALTILSWGWVRTPEGSPSNIVDFHPSSFPAHADAKFFYSIVDDLKYGDEIASQAPTLLHGHIKNFLVSPDREKIAIAADGKLIVVDAHNGTIRRVASVDTIYKEPKPLGTHFFRDDDFQWSEDSSDLFVIGDEYYESQGSQLFSKKGELWKYDIRTGAFQVVIKPFEAFNYFFGHGSAIYFSIPTGSGDLHLEYFDGSHTSDISAVAESPFYSFSITDYMDDVLKSKGVGLTDDSQTKLQTLEIGNKPYLQVTEGKGFKGSYYCSESIRSVFLPGDRYFLLNVPYCGNYEGQLLIDTQNGQYETLPKGTVVYMTENTKTYPHYKITDDGIDAQQEQRNQ